MRKPQEPPRKLSPMERAELAKPGLAAELRLARARLRVIEAECLLAAEEVRKTCPHCRQPWDGVTKVCRLCASVFQDCSKGKRGIFCSDKCRNKYFRENRGEVSAGATP